MRYWLILCLFIFSSVPTRALEYQVCTLKNDSDIVCDSRDRMHLFLQYIASNDQYSLKQLKESGHCGITYAENIQELRKYDAVSTPIIVKNDVRNIDIAWVQIKVKGSDQFHDFFMATNFLNCK